MEEEKQQILDALVVVLNKTNKGKNIIDLIWDEAWQTVKIVYLDGYVFEFMVNNVTGFQLIGEVIQVVKNERN